MTTEALIKRIMQSNSDTLFAARMREAAAKVACGV